MPELECFNFTHDKQFEHIKYLLYRHYRYERVNMYGVDYTNADRLIHLQDLTRLADTPVMNGKEFGVKMVIALSYPAPSTFFRRASANGQLEQYFPELFNCIGCKQDPRYHQDDVFDHTMLALDRVEDPEVAGGSALDVKLAVLFHDIGKPVVRRTTVVE